MRRLLIILALLLSFTLATLLFFWIHSTHTPEYLGYTEDFRGVTGPDSAFLGKRSWGLYAFDGRIGFFFHHEIATAYDPPQITDFSALPKHRTGLFWDQSDEPDGGGYMGGLTPTEINYFPQWSHIGITAYDGDDAGMSHEAHLHGYLIDNRVLAALLAAPLLPILWQLRRPARRRGKGLCPHCGYDLRAHLQNPIALNCPECGKTIARPTAASPE